MMRLWVIILGFAVWFGTADLADAQGCLSLNHLGHGYVDPSGFYRQGPDDCALASDTNSFIRQGRLFDPNAGAVYGMPKLADAKDATEFLKKCMGEKKIFAEETGTQCNSRDYESELARCNNLLYDAEFKVKRIRLNVFAKLTKAYVNILNSGLEDGCIGIIDFKIYPGHGISLPGHAVEFGGAAMTNGGEVSLEFYDPNMPTVGFDMTTGYKNRSVAMDISDMYRDMMGLKPSEWIRLDGITLKCPVERSCSIRALEDLEQEPISSVSTRDSVANQ